MTLAFGSSARSGSAAPGDDALELQEQALSATTGGGSTGHTRHSAQWKRGGGQKLDASGGVSNLWWGVDPVSAPRGWLAISNGERLAASSNSAAASRLAPTDELQAWLSGAQAAAAAGGATAAATTAATTTTTTTAAAAAASTVATTVAAPRLSVPRRSLGDPSRWDALFRSGQLLGELLAHYYPHAVRLAEFEAAASGGAAGGEAAAAANWRALRAAWRRVRRAQHAQCAAAGSGARGPSKEELARLHAGAAGSAEVVIGRTYAFLQAGGRLLARAAPPAPAPVWPGGEGGEAAAGEGGEAHAESIGSQLAAGFSRDALVLGVDEAAEGGEEGGDGAALRHVTLPSIAHCWRKGGAVGLAQSLGARIVPARKRPRPATGPEADAFACLLADASRQLAAHEEEVARKVLAGQAAAAAHKAAFGHHLAHSSSALLAGVGALPPPREASAGGIDGGGGGAESDASWDSEEDEEPFDVGVAEAADERRALLHRVTETEWALNEEMRGAATRQAAAIAGALALVGTAERIAERQVAAVESLEAELAQLRAGAAGQGQGQGGGGALATLDSTALPPPPPVGERERMLSVALGAAGYGAYMRALAEACRQLRQALVPAMAAEPLELLLSQRRAEEKARAGGAAAAAAAAAAALAAPTEPAELCLRARLVGVLLRRWQWKRQALQSAPRTAQPPRDAPASAADALCAAVGVAAAVPAAQLVARIAAPDASPAAAAAAAAEPSLLSAEAARRLVTHFETLGGGSEEGGGGEASATAALDVDELVRGVLWPGAAREFVASRALALVREQRRAELAEPAAAEVPVRARDLLARFGRSAAGGGAWGAQPPLDELLCDAHYVLLLRWLTRARLEGAAGVQLLREEGAAAAAAAGGGENEAVAAALAPLLDADVAAAGGGDDNGGWRAFVATLSDRCGARDLSFVRLMRDAWHGGENVHGRLLAGTAAGGGATSGGAAAEAEERFARVAAINRKTAALRRLRAQARQQTRLRDAGVAALRAMPVISRTGASLTALPGAAAMLGDRGADSALRTLSLGDNSLVRVPPEVCGMAGLRTLVLSSNCIVSVPAALAACASLETLDLSHNKLAAPGGALPMALAERTKPLRPSSSSSSGGGGGGGGGDDAASTDADADADDFGVPPPCLVRSLRTLGLADNELPALPPALSLFKRLDSLDLSDNRLDKLDGAVLAGLPRLRILRLGSNQITELPPEIGCLAAALTTLELHDNSLRALPQAFGELAVLQNVTLHGNRLSMAAHEWPSLGRLWSLRSLTLHTNALTELPPFFRSLAQLRHFSAHSNMLEALPHGIEQLASCTELDLHANRLRELPAGLVAMPELRVAKLNANLLSRLPSALGRLAPTVTTLELQDNQITSLPAEVARLGRLTSLNVQRNALTTLPSGLAALADFDALKELRLEANPLASPLREIVATCRCARSLTRSLAHPPCIPHPPPSLPRSLAHPLTRSPAHSLTCPRPCLTFRPPATPRRRSASSTRPCARSWTASRGRPPCWRRRPATSSPTPPTSSATWRRRSSARAGAPRGTWRRCWSAPCSTT